MIKRLPHTVLFVLALISFSTCSSQKSRTIASSEEGTSSISVELANKLNGGKLNFNAYREDNTDSILGFLKVEFKNCVAKVEINTADPDQKNYVECDVSLESGPIQGMIKAKVRGDKTNFAVYLNKAEANKYSVDIEFYVSYISKKWHATGRVDGWLYQKIGNTGFAKAEIHEKVDL